MSDINVKQIRKAAELLGLSDSRLRLPLTDMKSENVEKLMKVLKDKKVL